MDTSKETVVGVFTDPADARKAIDDLVDANFPEDRLGVLARDDKGAARVETVADSKGTRAGKGAAVGAAAGAGGGALWALGIAAGVLPAIGPVIAGGVLAAVLASAASGAVAGGVIGMLVGLGVSDEDARFYEDQFKQGRTIVVVEAGNRATEALTLLERNRGYNRATQRDVLPPTEWETIRRDEQPTERHI